MKMDKEQKAILKLSKKKKDEREMKMEAIKTIELGNFTAKIFYDDDRESPRMWDNLGTLILREGYSPLGDEHNIDLSHCNSWDDEERLIRREFGRYCIIVPVYGYSYCGLIMSMTPFSFPRGSGRLGTIVVSVKDACDNLGLKRLTKKKREHVIQILNSEIDTMRQYVEGDVYGYQIVENVVDDNGDVYEEYRDSCWGLYGMEHTEEEVNQILNSYSKNQQNVSDLWTKLGEVPVDHDDCLELPFLDFPEGTHREDVWHWFEEHFDVRVADLMYTRK